jgi:hypothetical protein
LKRYEFASSGVNHKNEALSVMFVIFLLTHNTGIFKIC